MYERHHKEEQAMKKWLTCMLIICALLCAAEGLAAGQENNVYRIMSLQTYDSRVKLRRRPSTESEILGQYFAGTEITVFTFEGDWVYGSIGGRTGYMMRKFLSPADADHLNGCPIGCALYEDDFGQGIQVREQPNRSSAAVMTLAKMDGVTVMGTVGEDWLHIAFRRGTNTVYGFVPSDQITQVDNFASAVVNSKKADETVNIRKSPSREGQVLGKLFSGVRVNRLFDDHVAGDGWDRVRVGPVVGYIQESFLDYSSAGCPDYRPPMTELKDRNRPLYADAARKNQTGALDIYDPFCVLGVFGGSYLVRVETWISEDEWGYDYGFLAMSDVKTRVTASVSTTGTLRREAPLYWRNGDAEGLRQVGLWEAGRVAFIYGSVDGWGNRISEYVSPDAEYLMVEVRDADGVNWFGFVPVDAVEYDPGLNYPESMTLG